MTGGFYRPFPEACPGSIFYAAGAKAQHADEPPVDVWLNSTLVPNPAGSGPEVAPYEKYAIGPDEGTDCTFFECNTAGPGCGQWLPPFPTNVWTKLPSKQAYPVCHKTGFKNCLYVRSWHGRFGFNSYEGNNAFSTFMGCDGGITAGPHSVFYQEPQQPDRTRYCTLDSTTTFARAHPDPEFSHTDTVQLSASVDSLSGIVTYGGSLSPNTQRNLALTTAQTIPNWTLDHLQARMTSWVTSEPGRMYQFTGNTMIAYKVGYELEGLIQEQITIRGPASFSRVVYTYDGDGNQSVIYTEDISASQTTLSYTSVTNYFTTGAEGIGPATDTITVSATLSGSLPDVAVWGDGRNNLLSKWPLDNDVIYPWRTDGHLSTGPLVARNETAGTAPTVGGNLISDFSILDYDSPDIIDHWWGVLLQPDKSSHTTIIPVDFGWLYGGEDFGTQSNPTYSAAGQFLGVPSATGAYTAISGSLPPGINLDPDTGAIYGTVGTITDPPQPWGVDIQVSGTPLYDGSIIGAPKSLTAIYWNFFDFGFVDVKGCLYTNPDTDQTSFSSWNYGFGMNVSTYNAQLIDGQLPVTATHWPRNLETWYFGGGAWEAFNQQTTAGIFGTDVHSGDGLIWGQKWAEILDMWPSQNFGRPAGADKFVYLERDANSPVVGVSNLVGSGTGATFTAIDYLANPKTITDPSGVWGGSSVGGFYSITVAGSTVTLGAKVYDLPSNWASAVGDDEVCFGKLRFPNCPSLLGRAGITGDMLNTTFAFDEAQFAFGMATATHSESVDLYDVNMALLSTQTATRVDDGHFTVPVAAPKAVWAVIHGAPNPWYMNNNHPQGSFATLEWTWDWRTNKYVTALTGVMECDGVTQVPLPTANNQFAAFTQTAHCLPFTPCSPRVVCFSPNNESFKNGITLPFPNSFAFDSNYGSKWQAAAMGTMTDLLAQTPHQPLMGVDPLTELPFDDGSHIVLTEDDGTCHEDTTDFDSGNLTLYYPHLPLVECVLSVPGNYGMGQNETPNISALTAAGIIIGWLSPVDRTGADVAYPPTYSGQYFIGFNADATPGSADTPWALHQRLCAAIGIDSTCRFKAVYAEDAIGC
jgi:hypothetical protein